MNETYLLFNECHLKLNTSCCTCGAYVRYRCMRLRLRDTRARAVRIVLGNVYLSSLTKNLWYEQREQLDSGGGGVLSQGAGHDGSFYRYAVYPCKNEQFSSSKSCIYRFSRARQQINLPGIMLSKKLPSCPAPCDSIPPPPESSCSRSSYQRYVWLASLSIHFPIHFARHAHEYPVTLTVCDYGTV